MQPKGSPPASRFGYVSAVHANRFVLFGGYDGSAWLNDMHEYNFDTEMWSPVAARGRPPSIRSCPSWCKEGNRVYVFGGYDGVRRMNDFFACDLDTYTWSQIPHSNGTNLSPTPVAGIRYLPDGWSSTVMAESSSESSSNHHNGYAGANGSDGSHGEAVYLYERQHGDGHHRPHQQHQYGGGVAGGHHQHGVHASEFLNNSYGGRQNTQNNNNHRSEQSQYQQRQHQSQSSDGGAGGMAGGMTVGGGGFGAGFGGGASGNGALDVPSPRYFHACTMFNGKMYTFGGYNGTERLNDMYEYDFETFRWAMVHGDSGSGNGSGDGSGGGGGEIPSGRSSLVSQVYKNSLYIFGGKGFVYAQTLQPLFILV